jgi:hypothetical protein
MLNLDILDIVILILELSMKICDLWNYNFHSTNYNFQSAKISIGDRKRQQT